MKSSYRVIAGLLIVAAVTISLYFYYPQSPAGSQQNNMAIAGRCNPIIRKPIRQQARFSSIKRFHVHTGNAGSLLIIGKVGSDEDLADLKTLAASTCPDVNFT